MKLTALITLTAIIGGLIGYAVKGAVSESEEDGRLIAMHETALLVFVAQKEKAEVADRLMQGFWAHTVRESSNEDLKKSIAVSLYAYSAVSGFPLRSDIISSLPETDPQKVSEWVEGFEQIRKRVAEEANQTTQVSSADPTG